MLGKTFKGLTDDMLRRQTEALLALQTHHEGYVVYGRPNWLPKLCLATYRNRRVILGVSPCDSPESNDIVRISRLGRQILFRP